MLCGEFNKNDFGGKILKKDIYFFGAGKIGKTCKQFAQRCKITIAGFIDNNKNLWGGYCEEIPVYSAQILKENPLSVVCITCNNFQPIQKQLIEMGIDKKRIITNIHNIYNMLLFDMVSAGTYKVICNKTNVDKKQKILIDFTNGMVLGGVEAWAYQQAKIWKKNEFDGLYLVGDFFKSIVINDTFKNKMLNLSNQADAKDMVDICVQAIVENLPCITVCNFPSYIFVAACIVKKYYPDKIKVIAVQHNDEKLYYDIFTRWQDFIDICLDISSQIKEKLLSYGMRKDIIYHLDWEIPCDEVLEWHLKNNEILQIGYAGRITISQKRADLFIVIAKELLKKGVQFKLNIAGTGDYLETLKSQVISEKLEDYFNILGVIDRACIPDFWKHQDVMISCSEWEGHSITQAEAMAAGAVPVITDVSGARDDVTNGKNGFIVPVGDIALLTDKIEYLYNNRDKLDIMSHTAHRTIYEKQKNMNQKDFWDRLFKG